MPNIDTNRNAQSRQSSAVRRSYIARASLFGGVILGGLIMFDILPEHTLGRRIGSVAIRPQAPGVNSSNFSRLSIISCTSCHGSHTFIESVDPSQRWKSAYQIWARDDPHSRAYASLWNDQSRQIVAALAGDVTRLSAKRTPLTDQSIYQSIINDRCISCHSTVPSALSAEMQNKREGKPADSNLFMANGVSCHSCHSRSALNDPEGNPWIERHTQEDWTKPGYDRASSGLVELESLEIRAQTCLKCHVGSPGRDVNHDLIAAGHPRLVFEYASSLARLPKHWSEKKVSHFNVNCWSIGQFASARSALALLRVRAQSAVDDMAPWPEFAEYNCHHCHHALGGHWYLANSGSPSGQTAWGTWAFPSGSQSNFDAEGVSRLRREMQAAVPNASSILNWTTELSMVDPSISGLQHLDFYLQQDPQLNFDEIYAWFLAADRFLADVSNQDPGKISVQSHMKRLREILEIPFATDNGGRMIVAHEIQQLIAQIRQIVLPMVKKQQATMLPSP